MTILPTVKVKWPGGDSGYLTINKQDFDPAIHTLYEAKSKPVTPKSSGSNPARAAREAELNGLLPDNWRSVKRIAQELDIEKPDGGWDEAIPMILDKEFGA